MRFSVPQFIDIEDKIAFQLTAKQLGFFAAGGVILFLLWSFFPFIIFVILGILVISLVAAFAFIRINEMSLLSYAKHGIFFFLKPRVFIWRKTVNSMDELTYLKPEKKTAEQKGRRKKSKNIEDLDKIVNILNSQ